ncbi:MAG: PilN domain-containing protein [Burkholderiales bacterium]|nr:PilN domain-containing protein [Burkholderiales bacterium]
MKLAIEITETGLRVGLYQQRLKGWACQQRAELPWRLDASQTSMAEQLVATLRPSLLAWGVKPDTSVIVAPSGDVGGVLSMTELDGELTDERIEKLIAQHLPYSPSEIAWVVRHGSDGAARSAQIAWIPRGWLTDIKGALERLALRLDEVFPLVFLVANSLRRPIKQPYLWVRATKESLALCALRPDGLVENMATVGFDAPGGSHKFALARYAIAGGVALPVLLAADSSDANERAMAWLGNEAEVTPIPSLDTVDRLFQSWLAGDAGWWQAPSRDWLIARSMPWLIGLALVLLASMAYLTWERQHLIEQTSKADDQANKLRPAHRKLEAQQRQLFQMTAQILDAESYEHGKPPLDPLAIVTDLLPPGTWVTHYRFDGQGYLLEGKGASSADMVKVLAKSGLVVTPTKPSAELANKQADGVNVAPPAPVFALNIEQGNAKAAKPTH